VIAVVSRRVNIEAEERRMIDNFSILLSHGFLMLAFWLLTRSDVLDREPPPPLDGEPGGFGKRRSVRGKAHSKGDAADA
jgi:hypothetical protein